MRTYGEVTFDTQYRKWLIKADPHVMIRLKAIFRRIKTNEFGTVGIFHSAEVCNDLEWFMERYPLKIEATLLDYLKNQAALHRHTMEMLEGIMLNGYTPNITGLAKPLREYQAKAVEVFWRRKALLNADQLGLGKSITAIGALTKPETLPAMVVCQTHLQHQWQRYFTEFLPGLSTHIIKVGSPTKYTLKQADVYIITYHKLAGWVEHLKTFIKTLVFDECQELRHPGSGKYNAAKHFREHASYCMGLSATPIYNYGGEIWNVMNIISPGLLGERTEFEREWCENFGQHARLKDPEAFGTYMREQFLMVRRTRKEVGRELPAKETIIENIEYNPKVLTAFEDVGLELARRILAQETTFHEKGEAAREFDMKLRQATGIAKAPFVVAFVQMLVEDGHKVLLAGWHRAVYDVWVEHFQKTNIKYAFYTGSESPTQKEASREQFMHPIGGADVLVISNRSGAGLDGLQQVCSTVVHGELDWSPGAHEQITGRLFRDGQESPVHEFFMVADGGSDPIVSDVLGLKASQIRGLLESDKQGLIKMQTEEVNRVKLMAQRYLHRHK